MLSEELFNGLCTTQGAAVKVIPIPSPGYPVRTAVHVAVSFLGRKKGTERVEWLQLLVKEKLGTPCSSLVVVISSFASPVELRYLWAGLRTTLTVDGKPQEVLVNDCTDEVDPQDVTSLVGRVSLGHTIWVVNWDTKATLCLEPPPLIPKVQ